MPKEQEEAIERLDRFKTIKVLYGNTFAMAIEQLKTLQEDIETVLNMLKEKDKEIENKDEIIDLMAEFIEKVTVDLKVAFGENMLWNRDEIKQYFERKSEE